MPTRMLVKRLDVEKRMGSQMERYLGGVRAPTPPSLKQHRRDALRGAIRAARDNGMSADEIKHQLRNLSGCRRPREGPKSYRQEYTATGNHTLMFPALAARRQQAAATMPPAHPAARCGSCPVVLRPEPTYNMSRLYNSGAGRIPFSVGILEHSHGPTTYQQSTQMQDLREGAFYARPLHRAPKRDHGFASYLQDATRLRVALGASNHDTTLVLPTDYGPPIPMRP